MYLLREHLPVSIFDAHERLLWSGRFCEALLQYPDVPDSHAQIAQLLENGDDYPISCQPLRWLRLDRNAQEDAPRAYLSGLIHSAGFLD